LYALKVILPGDKGWITPKENIELKTYLLGHSGIFTQGLNTVKSTYKKKP